MLSIVIPVYNQYKYLRRCVESALGQTLRDTEIVLVDDGSTDGSSDICDSYKGIGRIKVIHKENGGLISARRCGIQAAEGVYITFLDSDDWVDIDFYERLYIPTIADKEIDITVSPYVIEKGNGETKMKFKYMADCVLDVPTAVRNMYRSVYYDWSACAKIYKTSKVKDLCDKWWYEQPMGEDSEWNWKAFPTASKVLFIHKPGYHYFENSDSMSHQIIDMDNLVFLDRLKRMVSECEPDGELWHVMTELLAKKTVEKYLRLLSFTPDRKEEIKKCGEALALIDRRAVEGFSDKLTRRFEMLNVPFEKLLQIKAENEKMICVCVDEIKKEVPRVYLYGAGTAAQYVAEVLMRTGRDFSGFVISDDTGRESRLMGKSVSSFERIRQIKENKTFMIAADKENTCEIIEALRAKGVTNYHDAGQYTLYY